MRLLKMCISSSTEIKMFFSISNIGQTEQKLSSAFRINIIYTLFSLHYNTVPSDSRFHFNCLLRVLWHSLMILYTTIWDCLSWKQKIRTRRECVKSEGLMYQRKKECTLDYLTISYSMLHFRLHSMHMHLKQLTANSTWEHSTVDLFKCTVQIETYNPSVNTPAVTCIL